MYTFNNSDLKITLYPFDDEMTGATENINVKHSVFKAPYGIH